VGGEVGWARTTTDRERTFSLLVQVGRDVTRGRRTCLVGCSKRRQLHGCELAMVCVSALSRLETCWLARDVEAGDGSGRWCVIASWCHSSGWMANGLSAGSHLMRFFRVVCEWQKVVNRGTAKISQNTP
jgi:hypothetical protein